MDIILRYLLIAGKYIVAWLALPHRVERQDKAIRKITDNHLPHLYRKVDAIESKLDQQIGFCKGRQKSCNDLRQRQGLENMPEPGG